MLILDGEACHHSIGTTLQIVYVERAGRRHVESITPVPTAREMT
jgi:hypothetical protein